LNADADALFYVDEIWLFGSLLRQQDTVGDIDLAISTTRNRRHDLHSDGYASLVDERFYLVADAPQTLRYWYNREDWLRERAIFGVKRHPLLAGAQDGMDDLVSLAVPCRLLFDRKRGGRVDDDVLEQHPKSTQRSDTLRPQNVSLELAPSQIRPMDARWVSGFQPSGYVEPSPIFRGWTDDARRVFSRYPRDLRVFVDDFVLGQFPWRPKALKAGGLDGRQRVLIANATEFSGVSIVLNRRIEILPDRWVLHAELSNVELYRSRLYVDLASLSPIQGAAALILAADAEHMVRRAFEVEARPAIEIRLGRGNVLPDIQNWLIDTLYRMIKTRMIAIEPAGVQRTVSIKRV
jgi:hypothetical protein